MTFKRLTANQANNGSRFHSSSSSDAVETEAKHAAHNYHPLPIVFSRASGTKVWDADGKGPYLDFLSAYSAVNQGHCHPELVKALTEQASRLTLSSRAFYNDVFPQFAKFVTDMFGYDMVLPMNTGAEAVETAVKIARKWGYKTKGIPHDKAMIFSAQENFHGRTVSLERTIAYLKVVCDLRDHVLIQTSSLLLPCPQILSHARIMALTYQAWAVFVQRQGSRYVTTM